MAWRIEGGRAGLNTPEGKMRYSAACAQLATAPGYDSPSTESSVCAIRSASFSETHIGGRILITL
jgi:hypothetical protein